MEQQSRSAKQNFISYLLVLAFAVAGLALYANTFGNQMFWDDDDGILKNQYIKDWHYIPNYFSENLIAGSRLLSNYWRPVLLSVFSLEWHLWRDWAPGYHFVNASIHIADAVLLFFILFRVFKKRWLAFFTALIFLAHPLQTEAVAYVSGLGDSLSALFMFLAVLFYLKFRDSKKRPAISGYYFLSAAMYALALMSKETAIVTPAFIFICDLFILNRRQAGLSLKEKLKQAAKGVWPLLAMAAVYVLLRATVLNFVNTFNLYNEKNIFTENFHVRLFTFFKVLTIYLGLLFRPFDLHMERSVDIAVSFFEPSVIIGCLIFLGLLALAFTQIKRFPLLSFGILWFFIGLAPTSNLLVPTSGLLYEHWLYLPLIGIFLPVVGLGEVLGEKYNLTKILLAILAVFLLFLSVLTINRNRDWRDPVTFYNQTLKYAPTSYRVINNLGMAYSDRGDFEPAEAAYKRAISLDSSNAVAYHNLGNLYRGTGKLDLAEENFQAAIRLNPKFLFSYNALTSLYLESGNYQKAREVLEGYLNYSDSKIEVYFLLFQIAYEEKNYAAALSYLKEAEAIDPANQAIRASISNIESLIEPEK